jgi:hypothetical protein
MPQTIIPAGYVQTVLHWSGPGFGSEPVTVLGWALDMEDPDWDVFSFMNAVSLALCGPVNEAWAITRYSFRLGSADGPPYAQLDFDNLQTGLQTGTPSAPNLAMLITKATLVPGRQGRGRIFLPGPDEASVDGAGNLSSGLLSDLADACTALTAVESQPGVTGQVILHPEGSPLADTPSFVAALSPNIRCATQRRRMRN